MSSIDANTVRANLSVGYGQPALVPLMRSWLDDEALFRRLLSEMASGKTISELVVSQFITLTARNVDLAASRVVQLGLVTDDRPLYVIRFTSSAFLVEDGTGISANLYRFLLRQGNRSDITGPSPSPASHVADTGLASWVLPIPIYLTKQQPISVTATFEDAVGDGPATVDFTAHCIRLAF